MKEFFEDHTGQLSNIRLMSFIALGVAIWLTWYAITTDTEKESFTIIVTWVTAAFVPKALQKLFELRNGITTFKKEKKDVE